MTRILTVQKNVEDILDKSFFGYIDINWIISEYQVSAKTAERTLKKLNLKHANEKSIDIIRSFQQGDSTATIAERYQCTPTNITSIIKRFREKGLPNLEARVWHIHTCNEEYFDEINTANKAYLLGLLFADGYLSKYELVLQLKDIEPIRLLKSELNSTVDIRMTQELYRFTVGNQRVKQSLRNHGLCLKPFREMPEVPNEYLRDFVRGYFDGDGNFSRYTVKDRDNYVVNKASFTITSPRSILQSLKEIIIREAKLDTQMSLRPCSNGKNSFCLAQSGLKACKKIADWLYYDGCFCIERKRMNIRL